MVIPKRFLVLSLVVIAAAVAAFFLFVKKDGKADGGAPSDATIATAPASGGAGGEAASSSGAQEAAPLNVKAVPARRGELVIGLKSPGEAFTDRMITVKAEVGGVIQTLAAAEGRHVVPGELLVALDDREYRLRLEKQQALRLKILSELLLEKQFAAPNAKPDASTLDRLAAARTAAEKASESFRKGLISRDEEEKALKDYELLLIESGSKRDEIMSSSVTQTEVDVKIAEMDLEKTRIRAPYAGIVTDIKVSPCERVDPGRELFTLVDISRIKVKAKVLESEAGKMKVGREVDVRFSAYPGQAFKGTVEAVSPVINAEDKTCSVYIAVGNPKEEIKPGMHAEVEIAAEVYPDRLLVPQDAVLVRAGRKLVFVIENGVAKWRYVEIGVENEGFAEILDGVKEGELVITEGHFTLAHDARVTAAKN